MLSIAKSHRISNQHGLINKKSIPEMKNGLTHTFVGADSINHQDNNRVEIHYTFQPSKKLKMF